MSRGGVDGEGDAAGIDGGAAGDQGDGLCRSAVVPQSIGVEARVGDADLVAVDAVDQAAGTAGADQIVSAGRGTGARDVVGRGPLVLSAIRVLLRVPPPHSPPPSAAELSAMVELVTVSASKL